MKSSVYTSEQELLKDIIELHCKNSIDLDPMFYKGNFYKSIPIPVHRYDINPLDNNTIQGDARHLPIKDKAVESMILDPPFLFGLHGNTKNYYSSKTHGIFENWNELRELYVDILKEAYRILKRNGTLIFKCQDFTDSKTTLTHCFVWQWATEIGFKVKDFAILHLSKNKIYNAKLQQRHLRKVHSYFFVLKK